MRLSYLLITVAYCAGIFWLSSQSYPPRPGYSFPHDDKVAHAVLYGGLAGVVWMGMRNSRRPASRRARLWVPVAFASVYGVTDELHQLLVPPRTPSVLDWVADTLGALLAVAVLSLLVRILRRESTPHGRFAEESDNVREKTEAGQ